MADPKSDFSSSPGPGVDMFGRPVVDPTANVTAVIETAIKRQDDLRTAHTQHQNEINALRQYYEDKLRASDKEIREAESQRIDAIRAVDVGNVQRAAEVSAAQAEALRNTVAAAAGAAATSLAAALDPIQKDIADLRRAQYEAQGVKANVSDQRGASGVYIAAVGLGVSILLALLTVAGVIAATR